MSIQFFGNQDGITPSGVGSFLLWTAVGYACPGVGDVAINSIGVKMGAAGNPSRVGVYNMAGDLIVETDTNAFVVNAWNEWASGELTWHVGTKLIGGTQYRIVLAVKITTQIIEETGVPAGTSSYYAGDFTAGMPDPLPAPDGANDVEWNLRVGVEIGEDAKGVVFYNAGG